jgi:hypothetical protein
MRVIGEVPNNLYKITLFQWNGKYIIKIESGLLEQSYKVEEWDVQEKQLPLLLSDEFMQSVSERFKMMHRDFQQSLDKV